MEPTEASGVYVDPLSSRTSELPAAELEAVRALGYGSDDGLRTFEGCISLSPMAAVEGPVRAGRTKPTGLGMPSTELLFPDSALCAVYEVASGIGADQDRGPRGLAIVGSLAAQTALASVRPRCAASELSSLSEMPSVAVEYP